MQYAVVAVNTKTSLAHQLFTYKIEPGQLPFIKPGILVSVPFGSKNIEGFVLSLTSSVDKKFKLKSISKIIDSNPMLAMEQIELAKKISDYYLAPIGKVLSIMIPDSAIRLSKKVNIISENKIITKNYSGHIYAIYDRLENRIINYSKLISNALNKNKNILVIFPNKESADLFVKNISSLIDSTEIGILYGKQTKTQKYQVWTNILNNQIKIAVGTRSAVFAPLANLGLIIIDEPDDFGYKEEQSPYYNSLDVSKIIAQNYGANLVLGGIYPDVSSYSNITKNIYKLISKPKIINHLNKIEVITQDMKSEKSFISENLESEIRNSLENSQKILLFVNRKGSGSMIVCKDCNTILKCPRCNIPYHSSSTNASELYCAKCSTKIKTPSNCSNCDGVNLITRGIGTITVKKYLNNIFPKAKILVIEKDITSEAKNNLDKFDIIIATKKILDLQISTHLTAVVNIDDDFNIPDYKTSENVYLSLLKLASISQIKLFIQSFYPENYILENFSNPEKITNYLLSERKTYKYPPYCKLIKLTIKDKLESACIESSEKLAKELNDNSVEFIGPNPSYVAKKRDKYYYQIIIKTNSYTHSFRKKLSGIKGLAKWLIDVDPISLL